MIAEVEQPSAAATHFERQVAQVGSLFAVFDAARDGNARAEAAAAGLKHTSLFAGEMGELLEAVAPHLVEIPARSSLRDWWFRRWGGGVGVLVESTAGFADLRRHFRTILVVRGAQRRRYYFRFYDPRVLSAFLPVCTPAELRRFFGPVAAFHCEVDGGRELVSYARDSRDELICRRSALPDVV